MRLAREEASGSKPATGVMAERGTVLAGPSAELCENAFVARTA